MNYFCKLIGTFFYFIAYPVFYTYYHIKHLFRK